MEQRPQPLGYASGPSALPPPNDAVGLPRKERLNQRARYAALVTVMSPFIVLLRSAAPASRVLAHVVGVLMLVAACTAVVLIVGAVRQLNYAGRPAHVLAVCLCCLFAAGIFGIFAAGSFLFPFGSGH